jgi:hypothetical protein
VLDDGPVVAVGNALGPAHFANERCEHAIADGRDGGDGAQGVGRDLVAAGAPGLFDKALGSELAQVVGGLTDRIAVLALAAEGVDLGREQ